MQIKILSTLFCALFSFTNGATYAQLINCEQLLNTTTLAAKGVDHLINPLADKPTLQKKTFINGDLDTTSLYPTVANMEGFVDQFVYAMPGYLLGVYYRGTYTKDEIGSGMLGLEFQLTDCWRQKGWLKKVEQDSDYKHFFILNTDNGQETLAELLAEEGNNGYHLYLVFVEETDNITQAPTPIQFAPLPPPKKPNYQYKKHGQFKYFWKDFKNAVINHDTLAVAKMVNFPFRDVYKETLGKSQDITDHSNSVLTVANKNQFYEIYGQLFLPETIEAIQNNQYRSYAYNPMIDGDVIKKGEYLLTLAESSHLPRMLNLAFKKVKGVYKLAYIPYYP